MPPLQTDKLDCFHQAPRTQSETSRFPEKIPKWSASALLPHIPFLIQHLVWLSLCSANTCLATRHLLFAQKGSFKTVLGPRLSPADVAGVQLVFRSKMGALQLLQAMSHLSAVPRGNGCASCCFASEHPAGCHVPLSQMDCHPHNGGSPV